MEVRAAHGDGMEGLMGRWGGCFGCCGSGVGVSTGLRSGESRFELLLHWRAAFDVFRRGSLIFVLRGSYSKSHCRS